MAEIVISLKNVSKEFRLYKNPVTGPIKEILLPWRRSEISKRFWAVKNANMEIKRGEIVGIVGPNGAGKTTLLKMIAGLLPVDKGSILIKGKITALLALGVGVHPEFSGRENIYFSGLLLGMSKKEVNYKMEEIIEFAELGDFINQPFRTYSSGMKARLLFAISMSIDPDILIVDEALATGDSYFVEKSRKKIQALCNSGATILYVSHNLSQVLEICERCYFMAEGQIISNSDPNKAISDYNTWAFEKRSAAIPNSTQKIETLTSDIGMAINRVSYLDKNGNISTSFKSSEKMKIQIDYESLFKDQRYVELWIGFIKPETQTWVAELAVPRERQNELSKLNTGCAYNFSLKERGLIEITLNPLFLQNGDFSLWIVCVDTKTKKRLCNYKNIAPFYVSGITQSINHTSSLFWLPYEAEDF